MAKNRLDSYDKFLHIEYNDNPQTVGGRLGDIWIHEGKMDDDDKQAVLVTVDEIPWLIERLTQHLKSLQKS